MSKKKDPKDLLKVGRKPFWETPEDLEQRIQEYFISGCRTKTIYVNTWEKVYKEVEMPIPTITWLALFLWFVDRQSMYDYQDKPEFTCTIKKARALIENEYEELLRNWNCTWAIFALKNFGRKDKIETEISWKDWWPIQSEMTLKEMTIEQLLTLSKIKW